MSRNSNLVRPRLVTGAARAMPMRLVKRFAAALACSTILPGLALAAGDAENGHALARIWCANCHVIDVAGSGKDTAPPLPAIAQRGAPDQLKARAFLAAPHPPMPNFSLARQQIDDIVAYLNSLVKR